MKNLKHLLMAFVMTLSLMGCANLSPQQNQLVTEYVTIKLVEKAKNPQDMATKAKAVISELQTVLKGNESLTLPALDTRVRGLVNWKGLDPADALLVNALIQAAEQDLQQKIGVPTGALTADQVKTVNEVLTNILNGIQLAGY